MIDDCGVVSAERYTHFWCAQAKGLSSNAKFTSCGNEVGIYGWVAKRFNVYVEFTGYLMEQVDCVGCSVCFSAHWLTYDSDGSGDRDLVLERALACPALDQNIPLFHTP